MSLLLNFVGEAGLEPHKHRHPLQLSNIAVNFLFRKQNTAAIPIRVFPVKWKQVCCYAKASPYVLPKIGFIPPPYCHPVGDNGGLLTEPQRADQTRSLSCCGIFPYGTSLTAFHLTQAYRTHRALSAHSLKDGCFQANLPIFCKDIEIGRASCRERV